MVQWTPVDVLHSKFSDSNMSPQLIFSLCSRPSSDRAATPQDERSGPLRTAVGSNNVTDEHDPVISSTSATHDERSDEEDRSYVLDNPFELSDDEAPPSTQPRPVPWNIPPYVEADRSASRRMEAPRMEHYICFVYGHTPVRIKLSQLSCF